MQQIPSESEVSEVDAWKRRALSLELTEQYLREKLHIKEVQLEAIKRSPAWKLSKPLRVLNILAWKYKPELRDSPELEISANLNTTGATVAEQQADVAFFEILNLDLITTHERCAFVASYLMSPRLSESLTGILNKLVDQGFETVLIVASDFRNKLELPSNLEKRISVIRRPNHGYDFGSWAIANAMVPKARVANEVLLVNDSLYFNATNAHQFAEAVRKANQSEFEVTSVTDSLLHSYHLQSYFLHFKNGVFGKKEIQTFFKEVRPQQDRDAVIFAYEIGFSLMARRSGITVGSLFPWNSFRNDSGNSSIHAWRELMDRGWPFVKKEVFKSKSKSECEEIFTQLKKTSNFDPQILDGIRAELDLH